MNEDEKEAEAEIEGLDHFEEALNAVKDLNEELEGCPPLNFLSDGKDFKIKWFGEPIWDLDSELWVDEETGEEETFREYIIRECSDIMLDVMQSGFFKENLEGSCKIVERSAKTVGETTENPFWIDKNKTRFSDKDIVKVTFPYDEKLHWSDTIYFVDGGFEFGAYLAELATAKPTTPSLSRCLEDGATIEIVFNLNNLIGVEIKKIEKKKDE